MAGITVFLSCVSDEFRSYREQLRRDLDQPDLSFKIQENFVATGTLTIDKLDEYVRSCDAVVHLAGNMTGALAEPSSVDFLKRKHPGFTQLLSKMEALLNAQGGMASYTQWEAWLAIYHNKPLLIAVPDEHASREQSYKFVQSQLDAQQMHLKLLRTNGHYPVEVFLNADRLAIELLRAKIRDFPDVQRQQRSLNAYLAACERLNLKEYRRSRLGDHGADASYVSLRAIRRGAADIDAVPIPVEELLQRDKAMNAPGSMWISGEPGAGKTTLLRHMVRCAWSNHDAIGLEQPYLPMFLPLKRLSHSNGAYFGERLKNAIDAFAELRTSEPIPNDFVEAWQHATGKKWLFLFDGFDEVAPDCELEVSEFVRRLIQEGAVCIVTCRANYPTPPVLKDVISEYRLLDLSTDEQEALAIVVVGDLSTDLLHALAEDRWAWLKENPLLLTLAADRFKDTQELPDRRVDLYRFLVKERLKYPGVRGLYEGVVENLRDRAEYALEVLALTMSLEPLNTSLNGLLPHLERALAHRAGQPAEYYENSLVVADFVSRLGRHSGVFEVDGELCGWVHPTFREYLTAYHLAKHKEEEWARLTIRKHIADRDWRLIVLMYLSLLDDASPFAAEIVALSQDGVTGAHIAGQALLEGLNLPDETLSQIVEGIVAASFVAASQSLCASLLTSPVSSDSMFRMVASLLKQERHKAVRADLVSRLVQECGRSTGATALRGWTPQWFGLLESLDARNELAALYAEITLPPETRLLAFETQVSMGDKTVDALDEALKTALQSASALQVFARCASKLGRADVARAALNAVDMGWTDCVKTIEVLFADLSLEALLLSVPESLPVRLAIALAWNCESRYNRVPASVWQLCTRAMAINSSSPETRPTELEPVPETVLTGLIVRALGEGDSATAIALLEASADERSHVEVCYALPEALGIERCSKLISDRIFLAATSLLLISRLVSLAWSSAEEMARIKALFSAWELGESLGGSLLVLRDFVNVRIALFSDPRSSDVSASLLRLSQCEPLIVTVGRSSVVLELQSPSVLMLSIALIATSDDVQAAASALQLRLDSAPTDHVVRGRLLVLKYDSDDYVGTVAEFDRLMLGQYGCERAQLEKLAGLLSRSEIFRRSMKQGIMRNDLPSLSGVLGPFLEYDAEVIAKASDALRIVGCFRDAIILAKVAAGHDDQKAFAMCVSGAAAIAIDPQSALPDLIEALELEPESSFARLRLAYCYRLLGDWTKAKAETDRLADYAIATLEPDERSFEDWDALHLSLELSLNVNVEREKVVAQIEDFEKAGVRADVLGFVEVCSSTDLSDKIVTAFRSSVAEALGELLSNPSELGAEARAHLIAYSVIDPELGDGPALVRLAVERAELARIASTTLPLCRHIHAQYPALRERCEAVFASVRAAIRDAGGDTEWVDGRNKFRVAYPLDRTYPFPMYCRLWGIQGLDAQHKMCDFLLKNHSNPATRSVVLMMLDTSSRVYGECNFKADPANDGQLKFCDEIGAIVDRTLRILITDHRVKRFLFVEPDLKEVVEGHIRRSRLRASTVLIE